MTNMSINAKSLFKLKNIIIEISTFIITLGEAYEIIAKFFK